MELLWIGGAFAITLIVGAVVVLNPNGIGRLFTDTHLVEVCRGLAEIRRATLSNSPRESCRFVSVMSLEVFYELSVVDRNFCHQLTISQQDRRMTDAAGTFFQALIATFYGFPLETTVFSNTHETTAQRRFSVIVTLNRASHDLYKKRSLDAPTLSAIRELRKEALALRNSHLKSPKG